MNAQSEPRRALRTATDITMLPTLQRKLPLCEMMDGAQVEAINKASMAILEDVGVQFRDDIALEDWRKAGAKVDGEMVCLDRGLVRELIASILSSFTYLARSGEVCRSGWQRIDLCAHDRRALPARP